MSPRDNSRFDWRHGVLMDDAESVVVRPGMSMAEMELNLASNVKRTENLSNGFQRIWFGPIRMSGLNWHGIATFSRDRVVSVYIGLGTDSLEATFGPVRPWAELPEELRLYREIVCERAGTAPPVALSWGEISAGWHSKGGFTAIHINYR